tara:strand:+ start:490 stop:843 length:354 start_codon:yes stop_codon:yes gene_type:complete
VACEAAAAAAAERLATALEDGLVVPAKEEVEKIVAAGEVAFGEYLQVVMPLSLHRCFLRCFISSLLSHLSSHLLLPSLLHLLLPSTCRRCSSWGRGRRRSKSATRRRRRRSTRCACW